MTEKEKLYSGKLYWPGDPELRQEFLRAKELTRLFNQTEEQNLVRRTELLRELLGSFGEGGYIEPPFRCDYGRYITIGSDFYANYDCIIVDTAPVSIGDHVLLGPRVCICTAGHPVDAEIRRTGLEYGAPVTIGSDVWIGGQVFVNPGVTIGDGAVIGSGSVVTRDIPGHVVAVGNPCRVLRKITPEEYAAWQTRRHS